jgi:phage repressor protein C with HTH and peptisase S24 domain
MPKLSHAQVWRAIDTLAETYGLSPSGLAKRAGLDATTFNPSKRIAPDGRARWPSTESIAKVLDATGASLDHFLQLVEASPVQARQIATVPIIGLAQAHRDDAFDDAGRPFGPHWSMIELPGFILTDDHLYGLRIEGDEHGPAYRDGNVLLISSTMAVHPRERGLIKPRGGTVILADIIRQNERDIVFMPIGTGKEEQSLSHKAIVFAARILWASQ